MAPCGIRVVTGVTIPDSRGQIMTLGSLLGFFRGGNFFSGLSHGDPVAWVIFVICFSMTLYASLGRYRKWRAKQALKTRAAKTPAA